MSSYGIRLEEFNDTRLKVICTGKYSRKKDILITKYTNVKLVPNPSDVSLLSSRKKADLQVYLKSRIWEHVTFIDYVDWTRQLDGSNKILLPEWEEMILCLDDKVLITAPCDQNTRTFRAYDLHSRYTEPNVVSKKKTLEEDEDLGIGIYESEDRKQLGEVEPKVFTYVEQMPVFPGGEAALQKFIHDHLKYPQVSLEEGTQGTVMLRFVINENGSVGEVQVLKSLDTYCDREAKRVVQSLPRFTPGLQQSKPVKVWFQFPIRFEIDSGFGKKRKALPYQDRD